MEKISLKVKPRTLGKQAAKALRRSGKIPGVYYTAGKEAFHFAVETLELRPFIYTSENKIINLEIEGEKEGRECILKEVKFHPVTDKILHFDLVGIREDKKMSVDAPILLKGQSIGVREGGILNQMLHKIPILCFPQHIPNHIEIDISSLGIGKTIYIRDLSHENIEFAFQDNTPVVSVLTSRLKAEAAKLAAAGTPAATTAVAATAPAKGKK